MKAMLALSLILALFGPWGCATTGGPFVATDPETGRRAEGVSLGSTGSSLGLSSGYHYMPWINIYRESQNDRTTGHYFYARIVTPGAALKVQTVTFTREDGSRRDLPGTTYAYSSHLAFGGTRHVEDFKVALSNEDVRWMAGACQEMDVHMEGESAWAKTKLRGDQLRALRLFYHVYVLGQSAENFRDECSTK